VSLTAGEQYGLVLRAVNPAEDDMGEISWLRSVTPTDPENPYAGGDLYSLYYGDECVMDHEDEYDLQFSVSSATSTEPIEEGCTDDTACNFNPEVNIYVPNSCIYEEDCLGECGGTAVEDCLGQCDGNAVIDECGVCDDDTSNDCEQDECGTWGGKDSSCTGCIDEEAENYCSDCIFECDDDCCFYFDSMHPVQLESFPPQVPHSSCSQSLEVSSSHTPHSSITALPSH
jgi:hypothetical protein